MSRPPIASLPIVFAVTLAACTAQTPAPETSAPSTSEMAPSCGAEKLDAYVGSMATDETIAAIRKVSGATTLRVLGPDAAVTMDYRPDRLNVDVDAKGAIKSFRCT